MENQFNEQQSLQIIQRMIENSKVKFSDNSYFFILWGWLVLLASVSQFILIKVEYPQSYLVWPIIMTFGGILSGIEAAKLSKKAKAKTIYGSVMSYLWGGYTVCVLLIVTVVNVESLSFHFITLFILLISGLATMVTGATLNFTPLKLGGLSCWILLVVALFVEPEYTLLCSGFSMLSAYLVPGYLLKHKIKTNV